MTAAPQSCGACDFRYGGRCTWWIANVPSGPVPYWLKAAAQQDRVGPRDGAFCETFEPLMRREPED